MTTPRDLFPEWISDDTSPPPPTEMEAMDAYSRAVGGDLVLPSTIVADCEDLLSRSDIVALTDKCHDDARPDYSDAACVRPVWPFASPLHRCKVTAARCVGASMLPLYPSNDERSRLTRAALAIGVLGFAHVGDK